MIVLYLCFNFEGELGDYIWCGNLGVCYVDIDNIVCGMVLIIDMLMINQELFNLLEFVDNIVIILVKLLMVDIFEFYFLFSVNFMLNFENGYIVCLVVV